MRKRVLSTLFVVSPLCLLAVIVGCGLVKSAEIVYIHIKADGIIDPSIVPIQRIGDFYIFTNNVTVPTGYDIGIMVERNNMTLDGGGYTLLGSSEFGVDGIRANGKTNVTIQNIRITGFWGYGLRLDYCEQCVITKNNVSESLTGIFLADFTSRNTIVENRLRNAGNAIYIGGTASSNTIMKNDLQENSAGVYVEGPNSYNNTIINNNITGNEKGIQLRLGAANSHIYHNNFINNAVQADVSEDSGSNFWDNGTVGGNYWSDYGLRYPEADEKDASGMWNMSYVINSKNQDRYPFIRVIPEFQPWIFTFVLLSLSTSFIIWKRKRPVEEHRFLRSSTRKNRVEEH